MAVWNFRTPPLVSAKPLSWWCPGDGSHTHASKACTFRRLYILAWVLQTLNHDNSLDTHKYSIQKWHLVLDFQSFRSFLQILAWQHRDRSLQKSLYHLYHVSWKESTAWEKSSQVKLQYLIAIFVSGMFTAMLLWPASQGLDDCFISQ